MALKQVAARVDGDFYQSLVFWSNVIKLLDTDNAYKKVIFENDYATGIDDVNIQFSDNSVLDNGKYISNKYIQVKYHVDQTETYDSSKLIDPDFTTSTTSMLQKFWKGFNETYVEGKFSTLVLLSNWKWDSSDILLSTVRDKSNSISDDFFTKGPNSKIGKIREAWKKHLCIEDNNEELFLEFCRSLRFKLDYFSKPDLVEYFNTQLKLYKLKPIDQSTRINSYHSIYQALLSENNNIFTRDVIIDLLINEKLFLDEYVFYAKKRSIRYTCRENNIQTLSKQINSKKYIPDVFVETGSLKEDIRYFTNPSLFYEKLLYIIDKINLDDYIKYLSVEGLEENYSKLYIKDILDRNPNIIDLSILEGFLIKDISLHRNIYDHKFREKVFNKKSFSRKLMNHSYSLKYQLEEIQKRVNLLKSKVLLLVDTAGQGKTNLLCDLFDNYFVKVKISSVFFTGTDFNVKDEFDLENYILKRMNIDDQMSFNSLLEVISFESKTNNKNFIFVIDGINENLNIPIFSTALEKFTEKILKYSNIKIIYSCRSEYFKERFSNLTNSSFREEVLLIEHKINLNRTIKEEKKLFNGYMIFFRINSSSIKEKAKKILSKDPLLLRFFCEAYGDPNSDTEIVLPHLYDINRKEIFTKYQDGKLTSLSEKLLKIDLIHSLSEGKRKTLKVFNLIASWMLNNLKFNNVPIEFLEDHDSINEHFLHKIIDEDILFRRDIDSSTGEEVLNFTFDEYRDYILSQELIRILDNDKERFQILFSNILDTKELYNTQVRNNGEYHSAKEGITKYFFLLSKENDSINLKNILGKEEYSRFFSNYIFEVKQELINEEDLRLLKEIFLITNSSKIFFKLITQWDLDISPKLNVNLLLSWLIGFSSVELDFKFQFVVEKNQEFIKSLFKFCDGVLNNDKLSDSSYEHSVFEVILLLFGSVNYKTLETALIIYRRYIDLYPKIATKKILKYIKIKDQQIQEYISSQLYVLSSLNIDVFIIFYQDVLSILVDKDPYISNIITRQYLKNSLQNLIYKNPELLDENEVILIDKINTPLFTEDVKTSSYDTYPNSEKFVIDDPIDYETNKSIKYFFGENFDLDINLLLDEIRDNIKSLGYKYDLYKDIEDDYYSSRFGNNKKITYREKYLWSSIRNIQGKVIDSKKFFMGKYSHSSIYVEGINFQHRKFNPFIFSFYKNNKPGFFNPITLPKNNAEEWINNLKKEELEKPRSFFLDGEEWIMLSASFSEKDLNDKYSTYYHLDSYFIRNNKVNSYFNALNERNFHLDDNVLSSSLFFDEIHNIYQHYVTVNSIGH